MKILPHLSKKFRCFISRHLFYPFHATWLKFSLVFILLSSHRPHCAKIDQNLQSSFLEYCLEFQLNSYDLTLVIHESNSSPRRPPRCITIRTIAHFLACVTLHLVLIPFQITESLRLKKMNIKLCHL